VLTPPDPQLKGAWCPGGFNPCTYQVKKRFQNLPFKFDLHRYNTVSCEKVERLKTEAVRLKAELTVGGAVRVKSSRPIALESACFNP
jgi:hypothetical protein